LEAEFQTAIAHGELRLFFQPVVNIHASTIGAEALVRWQHPKNGLISPAHFIGMAEETGLIIPMGWWVLRAACQQLAEWARVPYKASWTIAVNVSAKQFLQNNFVDEVQSILAETGINPRRLKLELTESVMVQHVEDAIAKMSVLQAQGIKFSPQAPATAAAQDRPVFCARHPQRPQRRGHRENHFGAGSQHGVVGGGRRRGDPGAGRIPDRRWLPVHAGLPLRSPGAGQPVDVIQSLQSSRP
jgi:hypothetical protein